jgi:hypothetical protein
MIGRRHTIPKTLCLALVCLAALLVVSSPARADFQFDQIGVQLTDTPKQRVDANGSPVFRPDPNNPFGTIPVYDELGTFTRQAGSHPDFSFSFLLPTGPNGPPEGAHAVDLDLPPGLIGNPNAVTECDAQDFATPGNAGVPHCPLSSQVGVADVGLTNGGTAIAHNLVGIFNLKHGPDVPARFGFNYLGTVAIIEGRVRPGDYGISAGSASISQALIVQSVKTTFWGVPADPSHDSYRGGLPDPVNGPAPSLKGVTPAPFMSAPTSCTESPVSFTARGDSWEHRGAFDTRTVTTDPDGTPLVFEGCERLPFAPTIDVSPSSRAADSPTGLSVDLELPQSSDPNGLATSHLRDVKMTLPKGMSVSSSSASGLGACSLAQIGLDSISAPSCPSSSKIGTVRLDTPVLAEQLQGDVILAKQSENPFDSLLAMYIAIKGPGFYIKLPGKIEADPNTGQLTVTFDDNPQLPFERLQLDLNNGPRAPLTTPAQCGTYAVQTELTPWSGTDPVVLSSPLTINQGCATGGFSPKLSAGTVDSSAGGFSPFLLQITREDGESNLSRIQATLPEGLLAKLAGVPLCGDAQAASGACPAASQVGKVVVGAGAGSQPLYVPEPGKAPTAAYLAGPYKGAPYSLVVKVPAQAGPFDLGTVTVRNALNVDPVTTQVTASSDPLPQILQGIPIAYRDVRVEVNRPQFTLNPTSCAAQKVTSTLTSATGQTANPSSSFQASGCKELGFAPKLSLKVKGGTKRGKYPALTATLKANKGEANIAKAAVTLPHSEFLAQEHIGTVCTRVQYAADSCPKASVYGKATATTPLLDKPLSGLVYLRSSSHPLPDLVMALKGAIDVDLVGRIDSVNGGIRTTFDSVPDAPVTKFTLKMAGGKKGLLVNSRNLCAGANKATVELEGQNGKSADQSPVVGNSCSAKAKKRAKRSKK